MIYESSYWKQPLLESAKRLIAMKSEIDLSEETLAQIEKDIFIGFYSIRKLFDTIKVTDALKSNKYPVTWFPHQGREVTWLNNYRVDEHYNLNNKNTETRDLWFIASRLIHSFVFQISLSDQGGLEGIFFASDSDKNKKVYYLSVEDIADFFNDVGNNYVSEISHSYDDVTGQLITVAK
ncbi:hypothetical protein LT011_18305 [Vibrio cholerae]|uniref:hypothetical protein n=1 Tax=Vibrio cholerae TaxID=666 RepID=UPI001E30EE23|nr:hypothetical protein [Vibrio cholerae]EGR0582445.1 hypothetical protein [Vibrio cholerae]MCD6704610.1 hypothetical protein [Vibrio cholerae]